MGRCGAVRKYKQARNGTNRVTPKCQVLTLIVIAIAAVSARARHSRDVGRDIQWSPLTFHWLPLLILNIKYLSNNFQQSSILPSDTTSDILGLLIADYYVEEEKNGLNRILYS